MFVMQLIGRQADTVIDMPFAEAKACMEAGTVRQATQEEITAAMEQPSAPFVAPRDEILLAGYRMEPSENGGYEVFDAGGVKISKSEEKPLRNQLEARDFILAHARRTRGLPDPGVLRGDKADDGAGGEVDYEEMKVDELKALAERRGVAATGNKPTIIKALERDDTVRKAIADRDFEVLHVDELRAHAEQEQIDLAGKHSKPDIIDAISERHKAKA